MGKETPKALSKWLFPKEVEQVIKALDEIDARTKAKKSIKIFYEDENHG